MVLWYEWSVGYVIAFESVVVGFQNRYITDIGRCLYAPLVADI